MFIHTSTSPSNIHSEDKTALMVNVNHIDKIDRHLKAMILIECRNPYACKEIWFSPKKRF